MKDFGERFLVKTPEKRREMIDRSEIEMQVQQFLRAGGKIQQVPAGAMVDQPKKLKRHNGDSVSVKAFMDD